MKLSKVNFINWTIRKYYFIDSLFRKLDINTHSFMIQDICIKHIGADN